MHFSLPDETLEIIFLQNSCDCVLKLLVWMGSCAFALSIWKLLELAQNEFLKCRFFAPCQNRCRRPAYLVASKESDCLFSPKGPPKSNWFRKRVGTWDMASQPRWSGWHFAFKVTRTTGENNWRRDKVIWSMGWRDCSFCDWLFSPKGPPKSNWFRKRLALETWLHNRAGLGDTLPSKSQGQRERIIGGEIKWFEAWVDVTA